MSQEATSAVAVWKIQEHDKAGNLVNEKEIKNLITNSGRTQFFRNMFGLAASSILVAMGVGASTTTAQVTDTQLTYELIGNATRKSLTNTSGVPLSNSDIVTGTTTIVLNATSTATFYQSIAVQAVFNTVDGNNGNQFGEYALFTTLTLPGSPTASSGVMFNHLVDPAPTVKTSANSITAVCTLYY